MFTQISWTDYLLAVSILLAIYYLFVGVRYFSGDLKALLAGKRKLTLKTSGFPQNEPLQTEVSEDVTIKGKLKNITDEKVQLTQGGENYRSYKEGVEVNFGISMNF